MARPGLGKRPVRSRLLRSKDGRSVVERISTGCPGGFPRRLLCRPPVATVLTPNPREDCHFRTNHLAHRRRPHRARSRRLHGSRRARPRGVRARRAAALVQNVRGRPVRRLVGERTGAHQLGTGQCAHISGARFDVRSRCTGDDESWSMPRPTKSSGRMGAECRKLGLRFASLSRTIPAGATVDGLTSTLTSPFNP